jgi:hypothetical protein
MSIGSLKGGFGRQIHQRGVGQGGLHPQQQHFQKNFVQLSRTHHPNMGYVCIPRKQKVQKICVKVATLGSKSGGCHELSTSTGRQLLCKPPLEFGGGVARKVEKRKTHKVFTSGTPMGFHLVVAPTSQNAHPKNTSVPNRTKMGTFCKLHGGGDAPPRWPLLCILLSGQFWREGKHQFKPLRLT